MTRAVENAEIVRRIFELNHSGPPEETLEPGLRLFHPDIVFRSRISDLEGESYRGHEGMRRYWTDISDAFEHWRNELGAVEALGPGTLLVTSTFRATGRSGVAVELASVMLVVVREGLVTAMHAYPTRGAAVEGAGLDGSAPAE